MKKTLFYVIVGLSVFAITGGLSYLAFSSPNFKLFTSSLTTDSPNTSSPTPTPKKVKHTAVDPSLPKTAECPLNGQMFTEGEKTTWSTRRPLAVMIENHLDSRPLSGHNNADIVYEAVAEGGITRTMGVFYCGVAAENVTLAPVRSARSYFVKLAVEYDALYNHVGGAGYCGDDTTNDLAKALCYIRRNPVKDLDQFGLNFKTCHRLTNRLDHEVAYEHTMACWTDELYKVAADRGWTNVDENRKNTPWDKNFTPWKFKDDSKTAGTIKKIAISFSNNKPDYDVVWNYDASTNTYVRTNGGKPVVDLNTEEPVAAKTVIVQMVKEQGPLDEHYHMYYETSGTGKAYMFRDGEAVVGTWSKKSDPTRTKFTTADGKEFEFNRGQVWIELVSTAHPPVYE